MSAHGQTSMLVDDYPVSYIVAEGGTLWEIIGQFLNLELASGSRMNT
jgi:hypothetical protein